MESHGIWKALRSTNPAIVKVSFYSVIQNFKRLTYHWKSFMFSCDGQICGRSSLKISKKKCSAWHPGGSKFVSQLPLIPAMGLEPRLCSSHIPGRDKRESTNRTKSAQASKRDLQHYTLQLPSPQNQNTDLESCWISANSLRVDCLWKGCNVLIVK